jgi:hypothetical protein
MTHRFEAAHHLPHLILIQREDELDNLLAEAFRIRVAIIHLSPRMMKPRKPRVPMLIARVGQRRDCETRRGKSVWGVSTRTVAVAYRRGGGPFADI